MQKSLHINPDKCTGCRQCEMACSYENYGVFATARSRIRVFDFHETGRKVPYTCTQCDEAWCLHACPVEAITLDALTGAEGCDDFWRLGQCYAPIRLSINRVYQSWPIVVSRFFTPLPGMAPSPAPPKLCS